LTRPSRIAEDERDLSELQQARSHFEAGEFALAREAASNGLASSPDDLELLRVAGRAGVETGAPDAVDQLRAVAEQRPDSADSWRDLADALAAEGRTEEAEDAFRRVLEIEPEDEGALTALGHTAFQAGNRDEGVSMLEQVAARTAGASTASISLVEMYRMVGRPEEALASARKVAEAVPDSAPAALDVAELALETERLDEAAEAFAWLRQIVDLPEHEVGALQGMIRVELGRGNGQRALELAREAGAIDTVGRTTGVLAHLEADLGADSAVETPVARGQSAAFVLALEAPPSREEVERLIDATLGDLRRSLAGNAGA
jgi:tetratricopeptide (TPR) repeat protein